MTNKISLATIASGAFASELAADLFTKIVITCIAMVIGTTVAFYWRKFLENRDSKRKIKSAKKKTDQ